MKAGIDWVGVGVGAFIFNDAGELFLMQRGPNSKNERGAWVVPGGAVEFGETLEQAAIREVQEELGVQIGIDRQIQAFNHILPDEKQHWVTVSFKAHVLSGEPAILEPEKCSAIGWFKLDTLPSPIAKASRGGVDYFLNKHNK